LWGLLAGAGAVVGAALPVQAQSPTPGGACAPAPGYVAQSLTPGAPVAAVGPQAPRAPQAPGAQAPTPPATQPPTPPTTAENLENLQAAAEAPSAAPSETGSALALGGASFSAAGYIDNAIPVTMFRLRFDAAYDDNRPDRAEFFYPKCGCNPGGTGPLRPETRVDYQDISSYLEVAFDKRFSAFVEVPVRFLNPEQNENTAGLSDINAGFKYAFVACDDHFLTFQFRTYAPTGAGSHGLGTGHTSLEPAFLAHERLTDRLALDAELRDWVPIGGTDFEGNVVRYGVGLSYLVLNRDNFRVIPVVELVGWTVLDGKETAFASPAAALEPMVPGNSAVQDASGDTIVNAKVGVRFGFGSMQEQGFLSRSDLYVGYGRALTGDVWYKDILRVEFRLLF
jgi:hypothetical protein